MSIPLALLLDPSLSAFLVVVTAATSVAAAAAAAVEEQKLGTTTTTTTSTGATASSNRSHGNLPVIVCRVLILLPCLLSLF
jgi:hypothetical protein